MPTFDIVRETEAQTSFRAKSVIGTFDIQSESTKEHFIGNVEMPSNWQIGLIVGNSGTGKTTIAKQLFPEAYITNFEYSAKCVLDDFPKTLSMEEITSILNAVGFSSPPSWLKPYNVLSNGEKMRVDIAMAILSDKELIVFDEYTSVIDRTIAKVSAMATNKAIKRTNKKFIAVTCHHDIEEWLQPDWVFSTDKMEMVGSKKNEKICNLKLGKQTEVLGTFLGNIII